MGSVDALQILQHCLGLDKYGQGGQYRNHFVTRSGCSDFNDCMSNVEAGLMTRQTGNDLSGGHDIFRVTNAGIDYVALHSPKPPKVSRSKARYRRYLEYGDGFDGFIQYCRWDSAPERSWNGGLA